MSNHESTHRLSTAASWPTPQRHAHNLEQQRDGGGGHSGDDGGERPAWQTAPASTAPRPSSSCCFAPTHESLAWDSVASASRRRAPGSPQPTGRGRLRSRRRGCLLPLDASGRRLVGLVNQVVLVMHVHARTERQPQVSCSTQHSLSIPDFQSLAINVMSAQHTATTHGGNGAPPRPSSPVVTRPACTLAPPSARRADALRCACCHGSRPAWERCAGTGTARVHSWRGLRRKTIWWAEGHAHATPARIDPHSAREPLARARAASGRRCRGVCRLCATATGQSRRHQRAAARATRRPGCACQRAAGAKQAACLRAPPHGAASHSHAGFEGFDLVIRPTDQLRAHSHTWGCAPRCRSAGCRRPRAAGT